MAITLPLPPSFISRKTVKIFTSTSIFLWFPQIPTITNIHILPVKSHKESRFFFPFLFQNQQQSHFQKQEPSVPPRSPRFDQKRNVLLRRRSQKDKTHRNQESNQKDRCLPWRERPHRPGRRPWPAARMSRSPPCSPFTLSPFSIDWRRCRPTASDGLQFLEGEPLSIWIIK